ncbi:hypothetical protein Ruko_06000 [Ruthenibacterium sp. TH_2024_36131]
MAEEKVTVVEQAAEEKKAPAKKAPAKKTAAKPAAKKAPAKAKAAASLTIKLTKSLIGRSKNQIATAQSLGLKRVGDVTVQPDNTATNGKINKISHMVEVTKA